MEGEHEMMGHIGWPFRRSSLWCWCHKTQKVMDLHLLRGNKDWLFDFNSYKNTHSIFPSHTHTHTHTDTSKHTYRTVAPWPCSRFCGTDTRQWCRLPTASEFDASASEASGPLHERNDSIISHSLYDCYLFMLTASLSSSLVKALPSPCWSPATSASHLHPPELLERKQKKTVE